jgi:hypothetical protein
MALNILQCCGNSSSSGQKSALRAIHTLNPPPKIHPLAWGVVAYPFVALAWSGIMWGARGPFLPAVAMAVAVVTPVVFCAKATEKCNKNTKISCFIEIILFIIISFQTYCNSYIAHCSVAQARFVAWLEPKSLWSMDPGILGIAGKLLSFQEQSTDYIEGKRLFCSVGKLSCYLFCRFCHVLPFLYGAERSCNLNGTILPIHLYLNGVSLIPFISDFSR